MGRPMCQGQFDTLCGTWLLVADLLLLQDLLPDITASPSGLVACRILVFLKVTRRLL